jgi:hypothetical protein
LCAATIGAANRAAGWMVSRQPAEQP